MTRLGTFPEPAELDDLESYLKGLRAQIQNDIRHKTYQPIRARPLAGTAPADETVRDPFISPIHQIIRQLSGIAEGGDSASAQIAAVNRRSRVVRNIMRTLINSDEPLILLGDPGTGKTMTLQQAAKALAESEIGRVFPIVTIYVRLGEFRVTGRKPTSSDVLDYVRHSAPPPIRPYIDGLDREGRLILLFDGMDEMSRQHYNEHTEALSLFAEERFGFTKTLFSCRITDFSPRFMHRRLVLLPFDRAQITAYLRRYIPRFPLMIAGESWTLSRLARRISVGNLPLEPSNPFVLWLLSFHLQEKGQWPDSRVELLWFYLRKIYEQKSSADGIPAESAFHAWGWLAFVLTSRNRGSVIALADVASGLGGTAEAAEGFIKAGKRCGVLTESINSDERLLRFEHHRFQEFFTAHYVNTDKPEISWLDKLDAPRWQETIFNLVLMGGAGSALDALIDSIRSSQESEEGAAVDPAAESLLADRVELASRLLRQSGSAMADVRQKLLPVLRDTIAYLSRHGNPITQVKMMRACQNIPGIDLLTMLGTALQSPISWVRNQAITILAAQPAAPGKSGADLATEMGYDLANGVFLNRLPAYVKAVVSAKKSAHWWCLMMGAVSALLNVGLLLGLASAVYWIVTSGISGMPRWAFFSTHSQLCVLAYSTILLATGGWVLRSEPGNLWVAILGASVGSLALSALLVILWRGELGLAFALVLVSIVLTGWVLIPLGTALAMVCHYGPLSLYLLSTVHLRHSDGSRRSFFRSAWQSCGFAEALSDIFNFFRELPENAVGFLKFAAIGIVIVLILFVFSYLGTVLGLPFSGFFNAVCVSGALLLITIVILSICKPKMARDGLAAIGILILGFGAWAAIFGGIPAVYHWIVRQHWHWVDATGEFLRGPLATYIAQGLAVLMMLFLTCGCFYILWLLWRLLLLRPGMYPPGFFQPAHWRQSFEKADAKGQIDLLQRTDHQSVSLTPQAFLFILQDLGPSLKNEDAVLSTYWSLRDQMEQVLKQQRLG